MAVNSDAFNAVIDDLSACRAVNNVLQEELERLQHLCGEVYQVVGVLASDSGQFDSDEVERVLDNLSAASNHEYPPHESLLPFLGKGE